MPTATCTTCKQEIASGPVKKSVNAALARHKKAKHPTRKKK